MLFYLFMGKLEMCYMDAVYWYQCFYLCRKTNRLCQNVTPGFFKNKVQIIVSISHFINKLNSLLARCLRAYLVGYINQVVVSDLQVF